MAIRCLPCILITSCQMELSYKVSCQNKLYIEETPLDRVTVNWVKLPYIEILGDFDVTRFMFIDFILPPEVMKEGSFQHMQFPPFMPQEMAMKGAPNMMGGWFSFLLTELVKCFLFLLLLFTGPFMGNPQLGPEYMMGNEMPPNMQPELFMPMQR